MTIVANHASPFANPADLCANRHAHRHVLRHVLSHAPSTMQAVSVTLRTTALQANVPASMRSAMRTTMSSAMRTSAMQAMSSMPSATMQTSAHAHLPAPPCDASMPQFARQNVQLLLSHANMAHLANALQRCNSSGKKSKDVHAWRSISDWTLKSLHAATYAKYHHNNTCLKA